ncbi:nucleotidyltransferase domain protein [Clostridium homopropionicum DSM 5847]|uniref:Nucleotidyltransferase domain protein n=1 Tax=Clostridium homopropionicum DSM 5847 TaxID=1121318 RepID=A0A0L6ZEE8_9CLOT|nr:nucleotidyltransferase domain-containing protein [Clostridium homopropionicum]KOA21346.1 nucleotidyltransferase domain protein [Clostridium homopropionicum DSM 5847]SFG98019.1 Nucleotidyltransferase domain-containing protein [Clostridium homopropionicum]
MPLLEVGDRKYEQCSYNQLSPMHAINMELENIKKQIIEKYEPREIILFGSVAKGTFKANSDIDLCIIKDTNDKKRLLTEMYINIDSSVPFDLVLYTVEEWNKCIADKNCFAYIIKSTGVKLYG